jgi:hypothetical protein
VINEKRKLLDKIVIHLTRKSDTFIIFENSPPSEKRREPNGTSSIWHVEDEEN